MSKTAKELMLDIVHSTENIAKSMKEMRDLHEVQAQQMTHHVILIKNLISKL